MPPSRHFCGRGKSLSLNGWRGAVTYTILNHCTIIYVAGVTVGDSLVLVAARSILVVLHVLFGCLLQQIGLLVCSYSLLIWSFMQFHEESKTVSNYIANVILIYVPQSVHSLDLYIYLHAVQDARVQVLASLTREKGMRATS